MTDSIRVNPLCEALGAEVLGVDLREPVDPATAKRLNDALLEHIVLVIRDQSLDPGQYVRAMSVFGTPARQNHSDQLMDGHPEIWIIDSRTGKRMRDGSRVLYGANCWHSDHLNQTRPPKITALYSVRLPPSGGDTSFVNAYRLYDNLPAGTRARIDAMSTVYGPDRHLPIEDADPGAFAERAIHPLVRTHPETGRKALYCHPLKMQHIEGMSTEESTTLVDGLLDAALSPEITFRHRWRLGDLVLIDNRASMHRAERDYDPDTGRVMHRLIIEGDRPV